MDKQWIPGGEPFFIKKGKVGCLVNHGFTGSPYEVRELGEYLAARDITVSGPAIAGHATDYHDMALSRWPDWYASVRTALDELRQHCDVVFVAGLSLGGLQTLHLATHYKDIRGIVSLAAPVQVAGALAPIGNFLFRYTPVKYLHRFHKNPPPDLKNKEALKGFACYDHTPMVCVLSILEYMAHVKADLAEVRCPILIMQGNEDHTVQPENANVIYANVGTADKELIRLENSYHVVTKDFEKETVFQKTYEFIKKRC